MKLPPDSSRIERLNLPISPCIKVCKIDLQTNLCIGCKRTQDEIANWLFYTDIQKIEVLEKLKNR